MIQADGARKYGARVYCVGVKDFDEEQVILTAYFLVFSICTCILGVACTQHALL